MKVVHCSPPEANPVGERERERERARKVRSHCQSQTAWWADHEATLRRPATSSVHGSHRR